MPLTFSGMLAPPTTIVYLSINPPTRPIRLDKIVNINVGKYSVREKFALSYGAFAFPHNDNKVSKRLFLEIFSNSRTVALMNAPLTVSSKVTFSLGVTNKNFILITNP